MVISIKQLTMAVCGMATLLPMQVAVEVVHHIPEACAGSKIPETKIIISD